jgi:hypothetical protein
MSSTMRIDGGDPGRGSPWLGVTTYTLHTPAAGPEPLIALSLGELAELIECALLAGDRIDAIRRTRRGRQPSPADAGRAPPPGGPARQAPSIEPTEGRRDDLGFVRCFTPTFRRVLGARNP